MKAPEKIYLQEPTKFRTEKVWDNDTEYTRTDTFIEKACIYLEPIIFSMNSGDRQDTVKFIEDFKKHMKGE